MPIPGTFVDVAFIYFDLKMIISGTIFFEKTPLKRSLGALSIFSYIDAGQ